MPKITLEKLTDQLLAPPSGGGFHLFLSLDPEEAFRDLWEMTLEKSAGVPVVYYDGAQSALSPVPHYPLFNELVSQLKNPDLKSVYPLHKPLWEALFRDQVPRRAEPLLMTEKDFEAARIREDFLRLWEQRDSQPRIVFVDQVHKLAPSLWESLTLGMTVPRNQIWVWSLPRHFQPEDPRAKMLWEDFILSVENRLLEYSLPEVRLAIRPKDPKVRKDREELLRALEMNYVFLDIHQTRAIALELQALWLTNPELAQSHPEDRLRVLEVLGDCHFLAGENEKSLLTYSQAQNLTQELGWKPQSAVLMAKAALVYDQRNSYATAEKMLYQAWELAKTVGRPDLESEILFYFYYLSLDEGFILEHYNRFKALRLYFAEEGMKNHQAALQTMVSFMTAVIRKDSWDSAVRLCEEGLTLAEGLKNRHALSVGYHCRGVIAQSQQNYASALDYYQKSEKLRRLLGEKTELIKICNGTGFFCLLTQQFEEALSYFHRALKLLQSHRNFREMGMTLFNMGLTYFFSYHHDKALTYFHHLVSLMNILEMENLPFQSRRQIHSLIGLCQHKLGQTQSAWQSYYKAEQNPGVDDPVHAFFYSLLKAVLTSSVEDWNQAFQHAQQKNYGVINYYFSSEWGAFNRDVLKSGRQIQIWEDSLGEISLYEGSFYSRRFQDLLEGKKTGKFVLKDKDPHFHEILELARQEKTIIRLQKKISEMTFLSSVSNHIMEAKSVPTLLNGILTLIRQSFIVESGFIVLKHQTEGFRVAAGFGCPENLNSLRLHSLLFTHSSAQYFPRVSSMDSLQEFTPHMESLIFLPLVHDEHYVGGMVLGSKTRSLGFSEEELTPLGIAAAQTAAALDFLIHQEKLQEVDAKDELTGLASRQELRRRPLKDKTGVLYIHLDNFRTYNDKYGRAVGDLVLQKFAGLLHIASRQEDLVVRYGGVEFVILVPDTGAEGAQILAQRILQEMKNRKSFQDALETFLGRPVELTEDDQLLCSIGVSELQGAQSMEEALARVKNEGKNLVKSL